MSTVGSFDKTQHLAELNSPLFGGNPTPVTPAARKAAVRSNVGLGSTDAVTFGSITTADALFTQQPRTTQNAAVAVNTSATITGANVINGLITSTTAAAVAVTLPLATAMETAMDAAYGTLAVGDSIFLTIVNTGGTNAATLTTNTGWTLVGNMAVAANSSGTFMIQRNSATTYTAIRQ